MEGSSKIKRSFEGFNPYVPTALEGGDNADVFAILALAFEFSQLRYQLSKVLDGSVGEALAG